MPGAGNKSAKLPAVLFVLSRGSRKFECPQVKEVPDLAEGQAGLRSRPIEHQLSVLYLLNQCIRFMLQCPHKTSSFL